MKPPSFTGFVSATTCECRFDEVTASSNIISGHNKSVSKICLTLNRFGAEEEPFVNNDGAVALLLLFRLFAVDDLEGLVM